MANKSVEVVVISLSNATERRRNMSEMLDASRLTWRYFDAHRGLMNDRLSYDAAESKIHHSRELVLPQIACYSSHYSVLQEFVDNSTADFVLVLEDDIIFDTDFPLDDFCELCSVRGMDYVRLFGRNPTPSIWIGFFMDRSIVRHKTSPTGTQAYLMSRKGAEIFTEQFRAVNTTIDLALDRFWTSGMPLYSIFPYPVIERYSPTSIPIPENRERLEAKYEFQWKRFRLAEKMRKILANQRLKSEDAKMKRLSPQFRQVVAAK